MRLRPDERFSVVRFGTAEAVQSAIGALHRTKSCWISLYNYSQESELSRCAQVRLRPDERFGVVRFGTAEAVQSAIGALHGTKICGENISVTRQDPLMAPHNSKRPRRAPNPADHLLSRTF